MSVTSFGDSRIMTYDKQVNAWIETRKRVIYTILNRYDLPGLKEKYDKILFLLNKNEVRMDFSYYRCSYIHRNVL